MKSLGREKEKEREDRALDGVGRELEGQGVGYERVERAGSERPRRKGRWYARSDTYDEEWEEGRRRRGEI